MSTLCRRTCHVNDAGGSRRFRLRTGRACLDFTSSTPPIFSRPFTSRCATMSRTQISHRTVTTIPINVSQDHETPAHSSPPREEAVMKEDKGTDLVEDSFPKPDTVLKRASTVRPSQALQSDDDELYSLTPGRVATRALSLLERSNSKPEKGTRLSPLRRQSGQPSAQNMQQSRNMPPATSAMDALLSRGAVVHPPVGSSKQPTSKKRSSAMRADRE